MNASAAATAYRSTGMSTASGLRLVIQAYELTLEHLILTADAIERNDTSAKSERLSKALHAISEMRSVLDLDRGEDIAAQLDRLYGYFSEQLVEANIRNDRGRVDQVIEHWNELLDAWRKAEEDSHA